MKKWLFPVLCIHILISCHPKSSDLKESLYLNNRFPLHPNPYQELPLGAIQPEGWLKEMLLRQKTGATGHLGEWYPEVMGPRNGWLGGDGDQWERGPYWIDGLLPLAYILNDDSLKAKVQPWIEWAIQSQQPDGYFGPSKDYPAEPGLQRNNSHDWWPKMVMLKILKQYHSATGDQRVIDLLTKYFRYQLKHLPEKPLGHWTFWAEYRACDNLMVIYWLYNITGDKFLLDLADLIHQQAFDFTGAFLSGDHLSRQGSLHCVNLAQGIKEPMVYYQQHPEQKYADATKKAFSDLRKFMGQPQGLFGGDEALRGTNPTHGSELCSAVEMMFSLETILQISGDVQFADHLEKVAFNALPTQITDDFTARQYFQQPNQVMVTRHFRNFDVNHDGTDVCFGLFTGYPCCTSNMHQGWPKFTQNLFYATPDGGIAALVYAPSRVKALVGDGAEVEITEETDYPFRETISFAIRFSGRDKISKDKVSFPLHLRIPLWCKNPELIINGQTQAPEVKDNIIIISREWKDNDTVQLRLPMKIETTPWHENAKTIERGPLVFALKIGENWEKVSNSKDPERYGKEFWEVRPTTPWNFGLLSSQVKNGDSLMVITEKPVTAFPWNLENAPVELTTRGIRIPSWQLYNEMAGPQPWSDMYKMELGENPVDEEITLIPYGCTTLRISEFPLLRGK
jgi:DUF1680 family protein